MTALEAKTEKKDIETQVRTKIEKRMGEKDSGIPEKQMEKK